MHGWTSQVLADYMNHCMEVHPATEPGPADWFGSANCLREWLADALQGHRTTTAVRAIVQSNTYLTWDAANRVRPLPYGPSMGEILSTMVAERSAEDPSGAGHAG